jgi:hypothetical protein
VSDVKVVARVRVVIEFEVGNWGDELTMAQVFAQSRQIAKERVQNVLVRAGCDYGFRARGEPVVDVMMAGPQEAEGCAQRRALDLDPVEAAECCLERAGVPT